MAMIIRLWLLVTLSHVYFTRVMLIYILFCCLISFLKYTISVFAMASKDDFLYATPSFCFPILGFTLINDYEVSIRRLSCLYYFYKP
jgi:hypothetical protein